MMKKILTIALVSIMSIITAKAQDILTKKNGVEIKVKISEVNQNEIKYKMFDNLNGPNYTVNKSDIFMLKYENGNKELINQPSVNTSTEDMYPKGQMNAKRYYTKHSGASTGTLITSLLTGPIIGLIPAIACSSSEPNYDNLGYPSAELMKNTEYSRGYTEAAKKKKSGKVWKNYAFGSIIPIVAFFIVGGAIY